MASSPRPVGIFKDAGYMFPKMLGGKCYLRIKLLFFKVIFIGESNGNWHLVDGGSWGTSAANFISDLVNWSGIKEAMFPLKE